jgi:hypothetical protein
MGEAQAMNSSPIKRTCAATALILAGATTGVIAAKFWAPHWLATPWSAKAFVAAVTRTDAAPASPAVAPVTPLVVSPPVIAKPQSAEPPAPKAVIVPVSTPAPRPAPKVVVTPPPATTPVATDEDPAVRRSVRSFLLTCRSQMEQYKLQHEGRLPEFGKYPAWHQFTQRTTADGTPSPDGLFGPYLKAAPVNPLNGFGGIGLVRSEPRPGQVMRGEKLGFIICTTTGAVFATERDGKTIFAEPASQPSAPTQPAPAPAAAPTRAPVATRPPTEPTLPTPHPMAGTPQQRADALMAQLQTLRTELEMYKLQHTDLAPDFPRFPFWEQMVKRTRGDGATDGKGQFGPYLDRRPINPMNGFTKVECAPRVAYDYQVAGQQIGFVFDTSSGRLLATDDKGGIWRDDPGLR